MLVWVSSFGLVLSGRPAILFGRGTAPRSFASTATIARSTVLLLTPACSAILTAFALTVLTLPRPPLEAPRRR